MLNLLSNEAARTTLQHYQPFVLWFTGLSASGKSTLSTMLAAELSTRGLRCLVLDGDRLRSGLCSDLGFSVQDRAENIRRAGEVARLLVDSELIVMGAFISPYIADRERVRALFGKGQFYEIYLECPVKVCQQRDPKGLYRKAREGTIPVFTGITDPYEPPPAPDLIVRTGDLSVKESLSLLLQFTLSRCLVQKNQGAHSTSTD